MTLIDFDATWCIPCRKQKPIVAKLADKYSGKADIFSLNVDQQPDLAVSLGITSVPTVVIFKNGDEVHRFIGLQTEDTLVQTLEELLKTKA